MCHYAWLYYIRQATTVCGYDFDSSGITVSRAQRDTSLCCYEDVIEIALQYSVNWTMHNRAVKMKVMVLLYFLVCAPRY